MKRHLWYKGFLYELNTLLNDRNLILICLIAPVIYLFFYGSVYTHNVITKLHIGVIDNDHSDISRKLVRFFSADGTIHLHYYEDQRAARLAVEEGTIQGYLSIPPKFEDKAKSGLQARYKVFSNASSFMVANEISKRVTEVTQSLNAAIGMKYWRAQGATAEAAFINVMPVKIDISSYGNAAYGYSSFLYIVLFILIMHQLFIIALGETFAKEKSTLAAWKHEAGNNVVTLLTSKAAIYFALYMIYYSMLLVIAYPVFHLSIRCPLWQLFTLSIPFFIALTGIALILSSWFRNQAEAFQLIVVTSMPIILLSGYTWPSFSLPIYIKVVSYLLPIFPMATSMQSMTQLGATLWQLWPNFILLWCHAIIYSLIGIQLWKKILR